MLKKIVLLSTYTNPVEAEIIKGKLMANGIACLTRDGNVVPHLSFFSENQGIGLYVNAEDKDQALDLIKE